MNTFQKIYEQVKKIPKGKVATYGQIALMAGNPRWSQIVGYALHSNPEPGVIPCHRIVNKDGKISKAFAFGGKNMQRDMLINEDVIFLNEDTVDLEKCRYKP